MSDNKKIDSRLDEQRDIATAWIESEEAKKNKENVDEKKAKKAKKKPRKQVKLTLLQRLMLSTLLPLLVTGIVISVYSLILLRTSLTNEKQKSFESYAVSTKNSIESKLGTGLTFDNGKLYMGGNELTEAVLDSYETDGYTRLAIYYGDTSYMSTIKLADKRLTGITCPENVKQIVLEGGKNCLVKKDQISGSEYMSIYVPINGTDGKVAGMLFVGQYANYVYSTVNKMVVDLAMLSIILIIISGIIVGLTSYKVATSTRNIEESITALAEGYLSVTVSMDALTRDDEIGVMARSLQKTAKRMTDVVHDLNYMTRKLIKAGTALETSSEQTSISADEIMVAVEGIAEGAVSQAEDVEQANIAVIEMGNEITSIVESLEVLGTLMEKMMEADRKSEEIIGELQISTNRTTDAIKEISEKVNATDSSVERIREAVSVIAAIADETELLSLNANIEAARAGEAGRGFSVVATQISKLAADSALAAARIAETIEILSNDSHAAVEVMQEVDDIVKVQQGKLRETRDTFDEVSHGIGETISETEIIQGKSRNCDQARIQVIDVIDRLATVSEENTSSTEKTTVNMNELNKTINLVATSSKNLQKMAVNLEESVQFFKL